VVATPTSEETNISSKLSRTASSTLDFPATALDNLLKKLDLDFSSPLSKVSFFSLEKYLFKKAHVFFLVFKAIKFNQIYAIKKTTL
tara:strand:- start:367 stop:624 length:258 start_codon:yes stop_codon:yes gene_type:complete